MKNIISTIFLLAFLLVGCVTTYQNPVDSPVATIYGTFDNREDHVAFFEDELTFRKNIAGKPFKHPILVVSFVDGEQVTMRDVPVQVSPGRRIIDLELTDRVRHVRIKFEANFDPSITYIAKYDIEPLENTELVYIWIENYDTGEVLSEKNQELCYQSNKILYSSLYLYDSNHKCRSKTNFNVCFTAF